MEEKSRIDWDTFPTLAEWVNRPPAEFRERLDFLAARGRQETAPAAQKGIQIAVQLLPVLNKNYGGKA